MLHFITWQQFIYTAAVLVVIYYVTVGLLFFRQEMQHYLSGKRKPEKLKRDWEEELEDEDLMGQAKEQDGLNSISLSGFDFGSTAKETQLGIIPDILEEVKSIFHILERDNGTKEDFISLFDLVSAKYPQIKGSPNQDALNDYIRTNLPFEISDEELENLWQ